jgi:hypothetical protein
VKGESACRRERLDHSLASELVPEADLVSVGHEHPGRKRVFELVGAAPADTLHEPYRRLWTRERDGVDDPQSLTACACEPGEDRCASRLRDVAGARLERLSHEERVAGGPAVQVAGIDIAPSGELGHGRFRQRFETNVLDRRTRRYLAENAPQRMRPVELVVAIRHHGESTECVDSPPEEAQDVERRLICPVGVLDDEDRVAPRE